MPHEESRCANCGGHVAPRAESGRTRAFRWGLLLPIPADIEIPTCERCGETYVTAEQTPELERRMQAVFKSWSAEHVGELVRILCQRHGVNQKQIAGICDVTPSHLSHILGAKKAPSITLIRLLEAFIACAAEFERQRLGRPFQVGTAFPHVVRSASQSGFVAVPAGVYQRVEEPIRSAKPEAAA